MINQESSEIGEGRPTIGLRMPDIYKISCECSKGYIGQTGRTVLERVNEHQRYMRLGYPEKSTVAQHSYDTGQRIMFCETALVEIHISIYPTYLPISIFSFIHNVSYNMKLYDQRDACFIFILFLLFFYRLI
ncbi:hypothetical protein C0J52_15256 [Blattella germanica]|nr:hypothetical protein C0J52_15256 [Blattella germanica]